MYLEVWVLIGLHGNQQSMCRNLSSLVLCLLFYLFLLLVSIHFCWISYLAYPNLLGTKALMLLLLCLAVEPLMDWVMGTWHFIVVHLSV